MYFLKVCVDIREQFSWEMPAQGLAGGCNQDVGGEGGDCSHRRLEEPRASVVKLTLPGFWWETTLPHHMGLCTGLPRCSPDRHLSADDLTGSRQVGSHHGFYDLASEVTCRHFCHLLLVTLPNSDTMWKNTYYVRMWIPEWDLQGLATTQHKSKTSK